ncbi:malonate decarboxylase acyl carrier protein [Ancylobacter sp. MQZ15Z-1]|uniref:Malonate decarboxylase acyl carrier protein n=1 Tax=Ancylobacter mangrovi TaxID=2972472 RepID=A0A9X2PJ72_9HYPH|nr:malonate decarboxylase acyl carrier protein [Ancylobacter mangrovi]MCS0497238.1 malonate decarboxylase acyl carrier protein [Ancylobacter mangrovi]
MERLEFRFAGRPGTPVAETGEALVGVVGSGNLEVMIERVDLGGGCLAVVDTSIHGFGDTWQQVLADFVDRRGLANIRLSINDGGATPAVVVLRLDQAWAGLEEGER